MKTSILKGKSSRISTIDVSNMHIAQNTPMDFMLYARINWLRSLRGNDMKYIQYILYISPRAG